MQQRHRAVSLRQHGFLVFILLRLVCWYSIMDYINEYINELLVCLADQPNWLPILVLLMLIFCFILTVDSSGYLSVF